MPKIFVIGCRFNAELAKVYQLLVPRGRHQALDVTALSTQHAPPALSPDNNLARVHTAAKSVGLVPFEITRQSKHRQWNMLSAPLRVPLQ